MDFTGRFDGFHLDLTAVVGHLATPQACDLNSSLAKHVCQQKYIVFWLAVSISSPRTLGKWSHLDSYFSNGLKRLKPPTGLDLKYISFFKFELYQYTSPNFENIAPNLWMLGKLLSFLLGIQVTFRGRTVVNFLGFFRWKKLKNSKLSWSKVSGQSCQCTSKCQHYRHASARARKRRTEFPRGSCGVVVK